MAREKPKLPHWDDKKFHASRKARVQWAAFEFMVLHGFRPDLNEVLETLRFHQINKIPFPHGAVEVLLASHRQREGHRKGKHGKKIMSMKEFLNLYLATRRVQTAQNRRQNPLLGAPKISVKDVFASISNEQGLERKRLEKFARTMLPIGDD